jgi:hypothetical protein
MSHIYIKFDTILTFGKYKGKAVMTVFEYDASYIEWAIDNISWFKMSEKDELRVRGKASEEHYAWLDECFGDECDNGGLDYYDFCD